MPTSKKVLTLLVEDNENAITIASQFLSQAPLLTYEITAVQTLKEAKELLAKNYYDLILLDLTLDDAAGIQLIREIRSAADLSAIVIVTGDASEDMQINCLAEGVQEYFVKGQLAPSEILRRLRRVVVSHRSFMQQLFGPVDKAIQDGYRALSQMKKENKQHQEALVINPAR